MKSFMHRFYSTLFVGIFFILPVQQPVFSQDAVVSNRQPEPNEVQYFPSEHDICEVNPPGFVWLPDDDAITYILQCSSKDDFSVLEYQAEDITLNVHCPSKLFRPGEWYWRYAFKTESGTQSTWSLVRKFTIPDTAVRFPEPTLTDLINAIPSQHPKLLLRPETTDSKFVYLSFNFETEWTTFISNLEEDLTNPVITEEPPLYPSGSDRKTSSKEDVDMWRANRRIVVPLLERAANYAFAYAIMGEDNYRQKAKAIIMPMMKWDPYGSTGWQMNDEIAMPMLNLVSRVYTWAYSVFTEEERQLIIETMTKRANDAYEHLLRSQHTVKPFGSHNNRAWHFLGEASIAFIDDIPEAKTWLKYSMDVFYTVYPAWNDNDGGWHEGIAYWNSYLSRITWWLDIMESTFGITAYKHPFFQRTGDFAIYVQPPGQEFGGFGDMADTHSWESNQELLRYFAYKTQNPYWQQYSELPSQNETTETINYTTLLRLIAHKPRAENITEMPPSKIFEGTGIASLHSFLGLNDFDTHFLFKSSPFGSQSHGFNAQNSFVLWHNGTPVLQWSGHRDWHGSEHHKEWMWETKSDNSFTVNGKGQIKHSPIAKGKIVSQFLNPALDYVAGDATEAYGNLLTKYVRHVIFIKPDMIFLVDELEAPEPSTFEMHLHSFGEFKFDNQFSIRAINGSSGVRCAISAPKNLIIKNATDISPRPVNWDREMWHLTAETPEKSKEQTFVSLLKTVSTGELSKLDVRTYETENIETFGYQINNDKFLMIAVNDSKEKFTMGDTVSDAYILVLYNNITLNTAQTFAADASFLSLAGKTMLESEERVNYLVPEEQLIEVYQQYKNKNTTQQD
jgi:hypothetical protein